MLHVYAYESVLLLRWPWHLKQPCYVCPEFPFKQPHDEREQGYPQLGGVVVEYDGPTTDVFGIGIGRREDTPTVFGTGILTNDQVSNVNTEILIESEADAGRFDPAMVVESEVDVEASPVTSVETDMSAGASIIEGFVVEGREIVDNVFGVSTYET